MSALVWEGPPERAPRGHGVHEATKAILAELKAHPGRWARWPTKTNPSQLKKSHGVEAVGRKIDGKPVVYVRWPAPVVQAVPTPAAPKAGPARLVVTCDDCDFEVDAKSVPEMVRHTRKDHQRSIRPSERTPVHGGAA